MANKEIKQKIIAIAIALFNEQGLVNVRLQHIADNAGISIGNLAYHYPTKKVILQNIQEQISTLIEPALSEKKSFPSLIDFDNQLSVYYSFTKSYSFYFSDLLEIERNYPQIHALSISHLLQLIRQIKGWLELSQENGTLQIESFDDHNEYLAHNIWRTIQFWNTQGAIRGMEVENEGRFKSTIWSLIRPHLSENGQSEYEILILPHIINFTN